MKLVIVMFLSSGSAVSAGFGLEVGRVLVSKTRRPALFARIREVGFKRKLLEILGSGCDNPYEPPALLRSFFS